MSYAEDVTNLMKRLNACQQDAHLNLHNQIAKTMLRFFGAQKRSYSKKNI